MSTHAKHKDEIALGLLGGLIILACAVVYVSSFGMNKNVDKFTNISSSVTQSSVKANLPIPVNPKIEAAQEVETSISVDLPTTNSSVTQTLPIASKVALPPAVSQIIDTPRVQTFTPESLATHSTDSSCYVSVASKVYDVTAYISEHPGGEKNILKGCGRVLDGMRHPGGGFMGDQVQAVLKGYQIGELK
jgi:cytochrome b involved in lipid metabolism